MTDLAFKEELRAEMRLNRTALHDLRQVNRTLVVAVNGNTEAVHEMRDDVRGMRADMREMREDIRANTATIRELAKDIRANTDAILHVLDELRGRGPSAGTA